ncbi:sulfatase-like hydrolase/transferase [bacterium]|nr:sulfatase-like hydrolase/transferase [bacterium]
MFQQVGIAMSDHSKHLVQWREGLRPAQRTLRGWLAVFVTVALAAVSQAADSRPNVVLIVTDNHGAWTLGCYGNQEIRTPNIDRLASEGTLFENAFASNPVCSPTRATLLTGLVPSQHGVHCFLVGGRLQIGPDARCTLDEFTSLPEIFKAAGYSCGLVGKWHLGDNLHPQEGFDDYWITMPHGGTSTFYEADIIENGQVRREPQYLTDFWTDHAVRFLEQSAKSELTDAAQADSVKKPFFLMLSYNGPYSLGRLLLEEGRNRHAAYYADKELLSFPREKTHPWQFSNRDYASNPTSIRRVATEVSGVDDGVGRVMQTLDRLGLDENTLVVFVADQGWVGGHGGFFGMGDHTRPVTARDGMMRIPLILRWPGKIAAGRRSEALVANYDVMPTVLAQAGLGEKMPHVPKSPGRDFSGQLLTDAGKRDGHDAVFYEFEGLRCVRTLDWKYVHRHPNGPHELYDLKADPDEFNNLVDDPQHAAQRRELKQKLDDFYDEFAQPKYDLWRGGQSQARIFVGVDEELAQLDPVAPPPLTEGFTRAELKVPDGYVVELAAGPPLVAHPTMACFDDRGRLFVSENAGVNLSAAELEEQLPNSVRLLEDTDRDGRFDKSTVFADRMTFPMGGAWHDGALYVASPPNIWRLEDTDDDGVADKREVLVSQFGYTGNAASVHGCFNGPDGRIYWCDGRHGHEFRDQNGKVTSKLAGSYIFSCKPDGSDVRIHSGGGPDNPVEVDFTDEGEMLGTVNIMYSRPRIDCLVHWQHGGVYPHYDRVLRERPRTGDLLEPIHRFGHVAVSGMMRYRSGVFDHRFRDSIFATFFNGGRIVRLETERTGSTFSVTQREFLSAVSRDFHPTDVLEDADGSLLIVDTGGWFYRGCPTSQIAKPDIMGAIYRVRRKGMTPLVDPWGLRIDWSKLTDAEVAALLNDTRFKVSERAMFECSRRAESIIPLLQRTVERGDIRNRINAIWVLTRIAGTGNKAASDVICRALNDRDVRVRHVAARSLATYPDAEALPRLVELLETDDAFVRREAAKALGRAGDAKAVPALLAGLARCADRDEEHALIFALIELNAADETARGLSSESPAIRKGALIALDQTPAGRLTVDPVAEQLRSGDRALQLAALNIFRSHPEWSATLGDVFSKWLATPTTAQSQAAMIEEVVSSSAGVDAVALAIGRCLNSDTASNSLKSRLLKAIADGAPVECHASWLPALKPLLASRNDADIELALAVLRTARTKSLDGELQTIIDDNSRPTLVRVGALSVLSGGSGLNAAAFDLLLSLTGEDAAPAESTRAAQMLGASSLTAEQLQRLAPGLVFAGPVELLDLIRPFGRNNSLPVATAFLTSLENARSLLSLPTNEVSDIVKRYPPELLPRANALLDRMKQADDQKVAKLDALLPVLKSGVAERGRDVFFSEKAKCSTCHRIGEKGGRIGPDLTTIGANRTSRDLLESIVFPSASIVRQYESFAVATDDGKTYAGLIVRETDDAVFVQQATGEPIAIRRSEIDVLTPSTVSIMPQGLEQALTEEQLADVVAWLRSLRGTATVQAEPVTD